MEEENELEIEAPAGEPVICTRRFVAAPAALVFEMWTRPEHLLHWWGPAWNTLDECEIDLRVGGRHRFVSSNREGEKFRFHGEYLEVQPGRRLVSRWVFEGPPQRESVDSVDFEAFGDGTIIRGEMRLPSVEARDAQVSSERMALGMRETYERLDRYLETLPGT